MNTTLLIAFVLFLIGFISDLTIQQFRSNSALSLFAPFWDQYGAIGAAAIAGIITLIFGGFFLLLSIGIYQYFGLNVRSWSFVLFSTALAFVLGVIVDVLANYNNWLGPSFRTWYDGMGATRAALWSGGLSFAFTVLIAAVFLMYS